MVYVLRRWSAHKIGSLIAHLYAISSFLYAISTQSYGLPSGYVKIAIENGYL